MVQKNILDLQMLENDAGASTFRDYFYKLLMTLWEEGEGFSGKRPFGNSGWDIEVMYSLVHHGIIEGEIDSEGYLQDCNARQGDAVVKEIIHEMIWGGT